MSHSLDHLGHVEFDMLTHPFKMEIKVHVYFSTIVSAVYILI